MAGLGPYVCTVPCNKFTSCMISTSLECTRDCSGNAFQFGMPWAFALATST
jgi:hypothetical protein